MPGLETARSLLFAPGDDERKLRRALELSKTAAVVADFENGVSPTRKEVARKTVSRVLNSATGSTLPLVRVNPPGSDDWEQDLRAVAEFPLAGIVLPKATPGALESFWSEGPPVIATVETAAGLRAAFDVASHPRVVALLLGSADLALELRLEPRLDAQELLDARSQVVVDSAAAGLRAPFDVVHFDIRDEGGLSTQAQLARTLGFGGKACIHPVQVATVNRLFSVTQEQIGWARGVLAAAEAAGAAGVTTFDGEMIDAPVIARAERFLAISEEAPTP